MSEPDAGLCATCTHAAVVRSDRGSTFYRCQLAKVDPRFPKYPRLPVLRCPAFEPNRSREVADRALGAAQADSGAKL